MKKFFISIFVFLFVEVATGQEFRQVIFQDVFSTQPDSARILLNLDNINFLKNNEYFTPGYEGYTLTGYNLAPSVTYRFGPKVAVHGGFFAIKYNGIDQFTSLTPLFSAVVNIRPLTLIFGNLNQNHNLPEPVYGFERMLTSKPETGFQIKMEKDHYCLDTWVDWQNFIFRNDSTQERFVFGLDNLFKIQFGTTGFEIPVNILMRHRGGQIDTCPANIQTIANCYTGLSIMNKWAKEHLFIQRLSAYGLLYRDISPNPEMVVKKGYALYSAIDIQISEIEFHTGWFSGKQFFAPTGNQMFLSLSLQNEAMLEKNRNLLFSDISYCKSLSKGVFLLAIGELYHDLYKAKIDYSFGCKLIIKTSEVIK